MQMSSVKKVSPIVLAVLLAAGWVTWRAAQQQQPPVTYRAGDQFTSPPKSRFASMERLVLFIDSRCTFCQASVPFYRRLTGSAGIAEPSRLPVVVVGWEDLSRIESFVSSNDLRPSEVLSLNGRDRYAFRYTPTLLRVSGEGIVQDVWVGRMTTEQERRVLKVAAVEN